MAIIDKITIDSVQETLHAQIKKLAETFYNHSGIRLWSIDISWGVGWDLLDEPDTIIIKTSKR